MLHRILSFVFGTLYRIEGAFWFVVERSEALSYMVLDGFLALFWGTVHFVGRIFQFLIPSKLVKQTDDAHIAIADRVFGFFFGLRDRLGELAERSRVGWLIIPFFWLLDAFLASVDFAAEWWYSRDFRKLLKAAPAILLILPLIVMGLLSLRVTEASKIQHYRTALSDAEEANDLPTIELCQTKLNQLGFEYADEVEFMSAMELANDGDYEAAYARLKELAPLEEAGLGTAHLWIAMAIADGLIEKDADASQRMELRKTHTRHASVEIPDHPMTRRMQLDIKLQEGKLYESVEEIAELAKQFPDLHSIAAHAYRNNNETRKAHFHALRAISHYETTLAENDAQRQFFPADYFRLAESYNIANRYVDEVSLLAKAAEQYPDDDELQAMYIKTLKARTSTASLNDVHMKDWMAQLARLEPSARELVLPLVNGIYSNDPVAIDLTERLLQLGLLSSEVYEGVGEVTLVRNDMNRAIEYFEKARLLNPKASFSQNNLAWIYANVEPINMDDALAAANQAIQHNPDARFYETRGQIHTKLGNWNKAIADLQKALNGAVPDMDAVHESLAKCYGQLGEIEQAKAHRQLQNGLKTKPSSIPNIPSAPFIQ